MPTIAQLAQSYGCLSEIERAITYNPRAYQRLLGTNVNLNGNLRSSAGLARGSISRGYAIDLHPGLQRVPREDFIATFLHEVAHVMQYMEYGKMDHGATWWEAMIRLGRKPWTKRDKRTHDFGPLWTNKTSMTAEELF